MIETETDIIAAVETETGITAAVEREIQTGVEVVAPAIALGTSTETVQERVLPESVSTTGVTAMTVTIITSQAIGIGMKTVGDTIS